MSPALLSAAFLLLSSALLLLAACSGSEKAAESNAAAANVSGDPFGATGAPGADMTDNGATDGSNDLQENGS